MFTAQSSNYYPLFMYKLYRSINFVNLFILNTNKININYTHILESTTKLTFIYQQIRYLVSKQHNSTPTGHRPFGNNHKIHNYCMKTYNRNYSQSKQSDTF
jgi:hypothetical protein